MIDTTVVPENIIRIMKEKGISQTELANAAGVQRVAINRWLCRRSLPRLDTIALVAKALDVSIDDLTKGMIKE